MSGVVVLGSDRVARSWRQRIAKARSRRRSMRCAERTEAIVIVDHSPDAVLNLRRAQQMQKKCPELQIAVLRVVDPQESPTLLQQLAANAPKPEPSRSFDLSLAYPELSLSLRGGMLTYELNGD